MDVRNLRHRRFGLGVLTPVAILASSALVYQASSAAFTASTSNGENTWSAGSVKLRDDDANNVMFNVSGVTPGQSATKCINVTYEGSSKADIRMYVQQPYTAGGLGQYLDFTVEDGTGATGKDAGDCSGFTAATTLYSGTLDGLGTTNKTYATGIQGWTPATGSPTAVTRSYRLKWTLQNDNNAQDKSAAATFVWEAQNT